MLLAPVPEGVDEEALWARADALLAKIRRGAYHTKRRRRKALLRYHAAHREAGKVMFAKIGVETREHDRGCRYLGGKSWECVFGCPTLLALQVEPNVVFEVDALPLP